MKNFEKLESQLRDEAAELSRTPARPVLAPTELLQQRHNQATARRRLSVLGAVLASLGAVLVMAERPPEGEGKPSPPRRVVREGQTPELREPIATTVESEGLADLLRLVSDHTGADAELVHLIDADGQPQKAIYIPPRVMPVLYGELAPEEQHAVRATLWPADHALLDTI